MSDLIERLHDVAAASRNHDGETDALIDAADTIERLTARIEQLESEAKSVRDYIEAVYGVPRMRSESSIAALDVLDSRLSKESRINQMKDKRIELLEAVLVAARDVAKHIRFHPDQAIFDSKGVAEFNLRVAIAKHDEAATEDKDDAG